jgi:hypothetical protein
MNSQKGAIGSHSAPESVLAVRLFLLPHKASNPQPKLVLIHRLRRDGRLSWPRWLGIPWTVTHPGTNRAHDNLTSLAEASVVLLCRITTRKKLASADALSRMKYSEPPTVTNSEALDDDDGLFQLLVLIHLIL